MIKVNSNILVRSAVSMRAVINVDADVDAERLMIMNRNTLEVYHLHTITNNIVVMVVPYPHTIEDTLLVGILDNDGQYNCKFLDGVRAESINVNAI